METSITPHGMHDEKSQFTLVHDERYQLPFPNSRFTRTIVYVVNSLPCPLAVLLVVALSVLAVFMTIKNVRKSWELWELLSELWGKGCQPGALCNSWAGEGKIIGGK